MNQPEIVEKCMTVFPHTIGEDIHLTTAQALMNKFQFRHLPVLKAGKLVGVLSDRDLKLGLAIGNVAELRVSDIMTEAPYAVTRETPLAEVVARMAENKYGCAIVTEKNGKVIGVFTATDALKRFGETLAAGRANSVPTNVR